MAAVAFRGAAVAVRPLRVCERGQWDDGIEYLQRRMYRLSVKASMEDGEGEVTLNKLTLPCLPRAFPCIARGQKQAMVTQHLLSQSIFFRVWAYFLDRWNVYMFER